MRIRIGSIVFSLFLGLGLLVLGAASASAFSTTMTSNYVIGDYPSTGDTITVYVDFNSTGNDIYLLSVSVLFSDDTLAWDQAASSSPTYALYVLGGKNNQYLVAASTNLTLRAGTSNQILLDWQNTSLPGGNRDACGITNLDPNVACGFRMATLVFTMIQPWGALTLSNSSPGNFFQLADGSHPENAVSGDIVFPIPEPTTALLVGLGLAGLGVAGRRRSSPPHPQARQDRGQRQAQSGPE
jgi:hypothetical protein